MKNPLVNKEEKHFSLTSSFYARYKILYTKKNIKNVQSHVKTFQYMLYSNKIDKLQSKTVQIDYI